MVVGSSRISSRASLSNAFRISTRCWVASGSAPVSAPGSTDEPEAGRGRRDVAISPQPLADVGKCREPQVLGHGKTRHQLEMLMHHADAVGDRVRRALVANLAALDQHRAFVGLVQPEQDVHQGALAGAVLADHGMEFAGVEGERHRVERHMRLEALGDVVERDEGGVPRHRVYFSTSSFLAAISAMTPMVLV